MLNRSQLISILILFSFLLGLGSSALNLTEVFKSSIFSLDESAETEVEPDDFTSNDSLPKSSDDLDNDLDDEMQVAPSHYIYSCQAAPNTYPRIPALSFSSTDTRPEVPPPKSTSFC